MNLEFFKLEFSLSRKITIDAQGDQHFTPLKMGV